MTVYMFDTFSLEKMDRQLFHRPKQNFRILDFALRTEGLAWYVLFGIRVLIPHFKFQFCKSIKSSTFHIFLNLTQYLLRKNISFPKCPKITQIFTQNRQTVVMVISVKIQRCLKRERDICRKAVLSEVKTAFTCTPALRHFENKLVVPFHELNYLKISFSYEVMRPSGLKKTNKIS